MRTRARRIAPPNRAPLARLAVNGCARGAMLALSAAASARARAAHSGAGAQAPTATLEQCVTALVQSERAATFAGEMSAVPGTVRMAMRIDVQERVPGELAFRTVSAPGLGVWRVSDARVKIYKYLKEVTNLSAPASYRALVRFRWLAAKGHVIRRAARVTAHCTQPGAPPDSSTTPEASAPAQTGATGVPSTSA
jgi:hypothetical protein